MLVHTIDNLVFRCDEPAATSKNGMSLPAWWGTQLRGMFKEHFKREVCCQPGFSGTSDADCARCDPQYRRDCPYALCFEPLTIADKLPVGGAPGHLVLASRFADGATWDHAAAHMPQSIPIRSGTALPFGLVLIGRACEAVEPILQSLKSAGRAQGLGSAAKRVRVTLEAPSPFSQSWQRLVLSDLPRCVSSPSGRVPRVQIELTAPLRLLRKGGDDQTLSTTELITEPACEDLVKAALDVVTALARFSGEACSPDRGSLLSAAAEVATVERDLRPGGRHISANQSKERVHFESIVGHLTFRDVPLELLPWLVWGGRLHVGDRRTSGAGSWRLHLD